MTHQTDSDLFHVATLVGLGRTHPLDPLFGASQELWKPFTLENLHDTIRSILQCRLLLFIGTCQKLWKPFTLENIQGTTRSILLCSQLLVRRFHNRLLIKIYPLLYNLDLRCWTLQKLFLNVCHRNVFLLFAEHFLGNVVESSTVFADLWDEVNEYLSTAYLRHPVSPKTLEEEARKWFFRLCVRIDADVVVITSSVLNQPGWSLVNQLFFLCVNVYLLASW